MVFSVAPTSRKRTSKIRIINNKKYILHLFQSKNTSSKSFLSLWASIAANAAMDENIAPAQDAKYPLPVSVKGPTIVVKHAMVIQHTARRVHITRLNIDDNCFALSSTNEKRIKVTY